MRDPILHGTAQPFLPRGHHLLVRWPDQDAGTDELSCSRCGHAIYHKRNGTVNTWVETGLVEEEGIGEDGKPVDGDVYLYCLHCFSHMDYAQPVMREWYHLNDDGSPQYQNPLPLGDNPGEGPDA